MANEKADMSCARVKTYTASKIGSAERHNESLQIKSQAPNGT